MAEQLEPRTNKRIKRRELASRTRRTTIPESASGTTVWHLPRNNNRFVFSEWQRDKWIVVGEYVE